jgi:predicted Rossmann fold flavoprotein
MRKTGHEIILLEKTNKLLSKVRISGGGRCNVTHACFDKQELIKNYPRGYKELQQVFSRFSVQETITWFKQQGVVLKTEADGRMFPYSDSSQTIVDCFLNLAQQYGIKIKTQCEVIEIQKKADGFIVKSTNEAFSAEAVICALGGHNKSGAYAVLKSLGHSIEEPIPSLFTLNLPNESIKKELQGVSVLQAEVKLSDSKLSYAGPVLITHWGLSGPAVLKLSAFAAKEFFNRDYMSTIFVNWAYPLKTHEAETAIKQFQQEKHKALPWSNPLFNLPRRLWEFHCLISGIDNNKPWAEVKNKDLARLATNITAQQFRMEGKTTFKEEFVTCGGVSLKEIDFKTMQSRIVPGLYFCGEVLNIDGITGGFNFQSAWSTAWICAQNI